jgi:phosphate starvation-inducible PhoH-like protein
MVVTGDLGQVDLPRGVESGLKVAWDILADVKGVGRIELAPVDIIRHQVVSRITAAYEAYENRGK